MLEMLHPICMYDEKKSGQFRDRETLINILRKYIPTLDEFYHVQGRSVPWSRIDEGMEKVVL